MMPDPLPGWQCPRCQRINAPSAAHCDCPNVKVLPDPKPLKPVRGIVDGQPTGRRTPESDAAKWCAALFHRRLTSPWAPKEITAFLRIGPIAPDDRALIERYYASERPKGDDGRHRRDLSTFLDNFAGELDRARAYRPFTGVRKAPNIDMALWKTFLASINRQYEDPARAMPFLREDFAKWLRLR